MILTFCFFFQIADVELQTIFGVFKVLLRIFFDLVNLGLHLTECGLKRVSVVQLDLADEANDAVVALVVLSSGLELAPRADHLR